MFTKLIDTHIDTVFLKMSKSSSVKLDMFQLLIVTFNSAANGLDKLGCSSLLAAVAMLTAEVQDSFCIFL